MRCLISVESRDQDVLLACVAQRFDNGGNLLGGFTGAVDNLAGSLAHPARKIELCKAQIGGRRRLDAREGIGWRNVSVCHVT